MKQKIKIERRIHNMWKGQEEIKKTLKVEIPSVIGRFHYFYSSKKGRISLIEILAPFPSWEICGGGIVKIQRFPTKIEADKFIRNILQ